MFFNNIGIKPKDTMTILRQKTTVPFHAKDIYNHRSAYRRVKLHGISPNDRLIQYLTSQKTHYSLETTAGNLIQYLFLALPESINLYLQNPDIIIVDATYKTNQFEMPLLHIIGKVYRLFNSL